MAKNGGQRRQNLRTRIAERIRDDIQEGRFGQGELVDSERQLCVGYGVSRVTVRAALDLLEGEGLIERCPGRGAMVVGWRGGGQGGARGKVDGRIVFVRVVANPWTSDVSLGIERYCQEGQVSSTFLDARGSHERVLEHLRNLPGDVGGVILVPLGSAEYREAVAGLVDRGVAVVCVDRVIEGLDISSVTVDNFTGGYLAGCHLWELWGRPVYCIGAADQSSMLRHRADGKRSAMIECGVDKPDDYFRSITIAEEAMSFDIEAQRQGGYEAASELFEQGADRQGGWSVFAVKDFVAEGVYRAAVERGLEVGKDVAIVGFGDGYVAEQLDPPLSSILKARTGLGYAAAKLVCQIVSEQSERVIHEVLPTRLISRASSMGMTDRRGGENGQ